MSNQNNNVNAYGIIPIQKSEQNLKIDLNNELVQKINKLNKMSERIRLLGKNGYDYKQIAKILNIRQQWPYNVLHQILKTK